MYLLLGNSHMERSDYEDAIQSFTHARTQMGHHTNGPLYVVSLVTVLRRTMQRIEKTHSHSQISGWKFDNLDITIRRHLCETLYAAGRTSDAVGHFHQMTSESEEETHLDGEHLEWILGEWSHLLLAASLMLQFL